MRKIYWWFETGKVGGTENGLIEVEDGATDEEIEEEVSEAVFNYVSWGWADAPDDEESHPND